MGMSGGGGGLLLAMLAGGVASGRMGAAGSMWLGAGHPSKRRAVGAWL